jgi:hypothetical protein
MNLALTLSVAAATFLAGCGGGGEDVSPAEAARMLLDQSGECFAIAAGRTSPDKFNAAAADISSVAMDAVCLAWPAGATADCRAAYAAMARPYSEPSQCKVVPSN